MIAILLDGTEREIPPGRPVCGIGFLSIKLTIKDLKAKMEDNDKFNLWLDNMIYRLCTDEEGKG